MSDAAAQIRKLWALIPSTRCKGLCAEACGPIMMSAVEIRVLDRHMPEGERFPGHVQMWQDATTDAGYHCPLLDEEDRCTAYEDRPTICRLWGAVERMQCPHGCIPTGGYLSQDEITFIMDEVRRIGGLPRRL